MLSKAALCVAIIAPVTFVLQGCGGGGATTTPSSSPSPGPAPGPAPAPAPVPTTTTKTTTTFTARTSGWDAETAVREMNSMYMGFNASNDSSPLGVAISFAGDTTSFGANVFCSGYVNTSCHNGGNDCRMSAALINHKVMTQQQGNGSRVAPLMNRAIGYVFNQTLTEDYFGKCAYLYDGADSLNVNQGCGGSAPIPATCDNENSAFYDMCTTDSGTSYHHCVISDPEIQNMLCKCESCSPQYGTVIPPEHKQDQTCFYEMPALYVPYDDPSSYTPSSTNHLRDAMKQRVQGDEVTNQNQEWNEVVIDERLLIPQIHYDPTHTIVAFVYVAGTSMGTESAQSAANSMRDVFQQTYRVNGVGDIPVIELNAIDDFTLTGGPFKLPSQHRVVV